jgi:iron complex outermembrane recepter protein
MNWNKIFLFTLSGLVALKTYSQATNFDSLNIINIDSITVSSLHIPVTIRTSTEALSIITNQEFKSMPKTIGAEEALRFVPGVTIDNQANGSRVHMAIRGQGILSERGIRGIKIFVDGIPLNDPSGFAPDLYDIDWAVVKHAEVIRGPLAAMYGGGSNGGIINIVTDDGGSRTVNGKAYALTGSNGFYKLLGQVNGCASENLDYRFSLSHSSGDGYRQHQAYWANNMNEKMKWQVSRKLRISQLLFVTGYFNQNAEGLNKTQLPNPKLANPDAIPCNEYQKTSRITNGLEAQYQLTGNQIINLTGFLRNTDYKEPGSSAVQYRNFNTQGILCNYNILSPGNIFNNYFSAGADYQYQKITEHKLPNIKSPERVEAMGDVSETVKEGSALLANQDILQAGYGAYISDRLEIKQKLNVVFSLRFDRINNELKDYMDVPVKLSGKANFQCLSAKLGLSYSFSKSLTVYGNLGNGFLPPATEELANNPAAYGGFNKGLKNATSFGEELGIRGSAKFLFYDITGFILTTDKDFYRYRILPQRPLESFYGNAGKSQRYGIESLVRFNPISHFRIEAAYTFSHFKYVSPDSIKGNWLPNCPMHQLACEMQYNIFKNFTISFGNDLRSKWYIYTNKAFSNITQTGYYLFNTGLTYEFRLGNSILNISAFCKNITNVNYIAFTEPDPDGNSYQPAAGREIFIGIKTNF